MKFNKKEYIAPQTLVLTYDSESLLAALSGGLESYVGEIPGSTVSGSGNTTTKPEVGSKWDSGSVWDFDSEEDY